MDRLNAELNKYLSTPNDKTYEIFEDYVSMDATNSDNALDSGTCCAANNEADNVHETIRMDTSFGHGSNFSGMGACVSTNCITTEHGNGDHSRACVSTDDTTHTPEAGECLADSLPRCDTPNTSESDESLADSESSNDAPDTTETDECLADCLSTDKIVEDIFRIITELTEYTYTEKELNGHDLMALEMERRDLQEKGLFTQRIMSMNKEIVKERYVKTVNWDDYNQSVDVLKKYEILENSANEVNVNAYEMQNTKTVKILLDNKHLHQEILLGFEKIDKGKADIQRKQDKFKRIDIPGIVETMKTFEELGLLSELLIYKLKNIGQDLARLALAITDQIKRMDVQLKEINRTVTEFNEKKSINGKKIGTVVIYINCRDEVMSDVFKRKNQPQKAVKAVKQSNDKICRSEHKTPFCGKCGWQRSWVKMFKKKGIYVKEAAGGNDKHIWVNRINES